MKGLPFVLLFTAMTFSAWGAYGPVLHHGTQALSNDALRAFVGVGLAYFLIAVLIPVIIIRTNKEIGSWSASGVVYSLVAGSVGALGALGIILALGYGGETVYVMPLVFGFAPVVNTLVTAAISKTFGLIRPIFIVGIVTAALGAVGVLTFRSQGTQPVSKPTVTPVSYTTVSRLFADDPAPASEPPASEPPASEPPASEPPASEPPASETPASETPASETPATEPPASEPPASEPPASEPPATEPPATEPPASEPPASEPPATEPPATEPPMTEASPSKDRPVNPVVPDDAKVADADIMTVVREEEFPSNLSTASQASLPKAKNVVGIIFSIVLAALCWGSYGPMLHIGQGKMSGSRLRPFICVGIAYFLIAVLVPIYLIQNRVNDTGSWTTDGMTWAFFAGIAGAIGALGVLLAFNAGGKPYYVMPLIFGFAPVINTFISLSEKGTWHLVHPLFWLSLVVVIAGAVTVLITAPKPKPKPAS